MPEPAAPYTWLRYLAAKKTVDDRALNRAVWDAFLSALPGAAPGGKTLRVLEAGGGIGTMLERLLASGLPANVHYTMVDRDPCHLDEACSRLPETAGALGYRVEDASSTCIRLRNAGQEITFEPVLADLMAAPDVRLDGRCWDVLVAQAFLDLVPLPAALARLFSLLRRGGLFYFPINFDGITHFEPPFDPEFDRQVAIRYHEMMEVPGEDGNRPAGSQAGRRLFSHLRHSGAEILAAGSSDWLVFARNGSYPDDEAYFLRHILHFIETSLNGHPALDPVRFQAWLKCRHAQVDAGELVYLAHQLDFFGRLPAVR